MAYDRFTQFLNSVCLSLKLYCHDLISPLKTELLSEEKGLSDPVDDVMEQPGHDMIGFKECTLSWNSFDKYETPATKKNYGRKYFNLRIDDEIIFKRGQINIIIGPTASGKVSLQGIWYCFGNDTSCSRLPYLWRFSVRCTTSHMVSALGITCLGMVASRMLLKRRGC